METDKPFGGDAPDLTDSEKLLELKAAVGGLTRLLERALKDLGGYHELLQDELEDNERARDFLAKGQEIIAGMESMTQALAQDGEEPEDHEIIGLATMLQGVIGQCRGGAGGQAVEVELKCNDDVSLNGDLFQIQRLFASVLNGVGGAVPVGSVLKVAVEERALSDVQLRQLDAVCGAGRYVMVDVGLKDVEQGRGFSSVDAMVSSGAETYIPRRELLWWLGMVRHMGGDLVLSPDSTSPELCLLFQASEAEATDGASGDVRGTETILVVDDEDMIWDVVMDKLSSLGYTVLLAGNGREAVEMYRNNPGVVDLVIMDMVMPEMNGREAFERLKRLDSQVKVLFSSGYVAEEDAQYVMAEGAAGFLRKPYRLADLARQVRQLLDK